LDSNPKLKLKVLFESDYTTKKIMPGLKYQAPVYMNLAPIKNGHYIFNQIFFPEKRLKLK